MSQPVNISGSDPKKMAIPPYLAISILTIFSIGPQYFLNLSYILNQGIIQNGLNLGSNDLLLPSTLSNLAFAFGVPLGPVLARKIGLKRNYLTFVLVFLLGSVLDALSLGITTLTAGRLIQGISAGILFLTILPVSLTSFPNKIRNTFLLMAIGGLFGSSAVGAFFGSISLSSGMWRWLFILNIVSSILCLVMGSIFLPSAQDEKKHKEPPADKKGIFLLGLFILSLAYPLCNLMEEGFSSIRIWPLLVLAAIIMLLFIYIDLKSENPLVPFGSLKAAKPVSGTIMAVASHISLIFALAGINGFLRNNKDLPFEYLSHFYFWFFIGILITAILKTLLYDRLGAGILGTIGSLAVIYVSWRWMNITPDISLHALYFQIACLGAGVSMVLVAGALGTALAGDIHKASKRSVTLHSIRNFAGAVAAPLLGWFIYRQNAYHYEAVRNHASKYDPEVQAEMARMTRHLMESGLPLAKAKSMAFYELVVNAKKSAILTAYHDLFTIMLGIGVIMLLASIGKIATGKGRSLVQKQKRILLPAPDSRQAHK